MLGREGVHESAGLCFFVQGVGTQGDRQAAGHTDEIFGWEDTVLVLRWGKRPWISYEATTSWQKIKTEPGLMSTL